MMVYFEAFSFHILVHRVYSFSLIFICNDYSKRNSILIIEKEIALPAKERLASFSSLLYFIFQPKWLSPTYAFSYCGEPPHSP